MVYHKGISSVVLLVILQLIEGSVLGPREYCLSHDTNPFLLYSVKTSYDVVRGNAGSETICIPIQFWTINRHGTRYASESTLQEMKLLIDIKQKIFENLQTNPPPSDNKLCAADLQALSGWKWDESIESLGNILTIEGKRELLQIAQRYALRYPQLLSNYSEEQFYFRHTNEQRTWASCRAFVEGLFGSYDNIKIDEPLERDDLIRPYDTCSTWQDAVENNDDFREAEKIIFRKQIDYLKLLDDVSQRLGFNETLKHGDIDNMYNVCRFNKAWFPNQLSPWCSVFTKFELRLMEYYEDMAIYYKSGYAHEYNPKLGCMPLKYLMETFEKTIESKEVSPRVVALFTHDTMINMVYTALGFAKDDKPLKGTDYEDFLVNRKFKCSLNTPFAANMVVILHQCSEGDYKVQFFVNERAMDLEGCPYGLCSWEHLKKMLSWTKDCNLDFCEKLE